MRRKNGKRKTGFKLLLLVLLVMCGLMTYNKGKAEEKEKKLLERKASYETALLSEEERQRELEEETAYRQTKSYIEDLARSALNLVKPDEIILRDASNVKETEK